jgi:hypothetical protein
MNSARHNNSRTAPAFGRRPDAVASVLFVLVVVAASDAAVPVGGPAAVWSAV